MLAKLLFNPIAFVIITILCLVFSFSLYKSAKNSHESVQQLNVLEQEIEGMKTEVKNLEQQAYEAEQPFTKEKILRNELLMQKPGEYIVQIPEETSPEKDDKMSSNTKTPWEEWRALLF